MDDFESELKLIQDHLRKAEKEQILTTKISALESAFNDLDDLASDYPEKTEKLSCFKLPYVRQLLTYISSKRPDIDFDLYRNLVRVLLSNAKAETKQVIFQDLTLRKYLVSEFLPLWTSISQQELKAVFEDILELTPEELSCQSVQRPNMRIKDTVEILYLSLMYRWETSAPEDGKQGLLDGKPFRNTQMSRFAYVLGKITAGRQEQEIYNALARHTRKQDGKSYVSEDTSWMKQPFELTGGWFFEGCESFPQKQKIVESLTKVGLSPAFVSAVDDFVAGKSIKSYFPTEEEEKDILAHIREKELLEEDL
jgi:hypothetical protein